jgi:hypothetical protein
MTTDQLAMTLEQAKTLAQALFNTCDFSISTDLNEIICAIDAHLKSAQEPVACDFPPKGWHPCRYHKKNDCDGCGGSGWVKNCKRVECREHGCSGHGDCIITKKELQAAMTQTPPPVTVQVPDEPAWAKGWIVLTNNKKERWVYPELFATRERAQASIDERCLLRHPDVECIIYPFPFAEAMDATPPAASPAGYDARKYRLVPIEATDAMCEPLKPYVDGDIYKIVRRKLWQAMLAAAPSIAEKGG